MFFEDIFHYFLCRQIKAKMNEREALPYQIGWVQKREGILIHTSILVIDGQPKIICQYSSYIFHHSFKIYHQLIDNKQIHTCERMQQWMSVFNTTFNRDICVPNIIHSVLIHPLGNCNRSRIQTTLQCHHIGCVTCVLLSQ